MSRFTPTMPVMAPPYGSNADGELWVSALMQTTYSPSKSTTPELSWKTDLRSPRFSASVSVVFFMQVAKSESMVSRRPSPA